MRVFLFVVTGLLFSIQSNATEVRTGSEDFAWFLGDAPVKICLEISPQFGLPPEIVSRELQAALKIWTDFIASTRINQLGPIDKGLSLATTFVARGSCTPDTELYFYFGVQNEEINKVRSLYNAPVGFAHRLAYQPAIGRSKGMIWIAPRGSLSVNGSPSAFYPDWGLPYRLRGILLHTLGHTFGVTHFPGTIMRESLGANLALPIVDELQSRRIFGELSQTTDLNPLRFGDKPTGLIIDGFIPAKVQGIAQPSPSQIYKKLTGKDPGTGTLKVRLETNPQQASGVFKITDTIETHVLAIKFPEFAVDASQGDYAGGKIFSMSRIFNNQPVSFYASPQAKTYHGILKLNDQSTISVFLEANHAKKEGGIFRLKSFAFEKLVVLLDQ